LILETAYVLAGITVNTWLKKRIFFVVADIMARSARSSARSAKNENLNLSTRQRILLSLTASRRWAADDEKKQPLAKHAQAFGDTTPGARCRVFSRFLAKPAVKHAQQTRLEQMPRTLKRIHD